MADAHKELANQAPDYAASISKAVIGAVGNVGSVFNPAIGAVSPLLAEFVGAVIPNQRVDRLVKFAEVLEEKLRGLEQEFVRSQLNNENFSDLLEEGLRQAARSLSDERRKHIASLIVTSLSQEDVEYIEAKHLLRMLGEINDIEVIWLKYHYDRQFAGLADDVSGKHTSVLTPINPAIGDPAILHEKQALQTSYSDHLAQLGLLDRLYSAGGITNALELGSSGNMKVRGYEITRLGRILVRTIMPEHTEGKPNI